MQNFRSNPSTKFCFLLILQSLLCGTHCRFTSLWYYCQVIASQLLSVDLEAEIDFLNEETDQDHHTYLAGDGVEQDQVELTVEEIEEDSPEILIQILNMGTEVATDVATDEAMDQAEESTVKIYPSSSSLVLSNYA